MSNSSLVNYTKISPNKSSGRNHAIDTITIHCMAGNLSVEACGTLFSKTTTKASSNYGVGSDGRIGLYVEEKDRSWATSSSANDNRAVTIEVANDGGEPDWHVSDKALKSTIKLIADICKRNNIKKLLWKNDKSLIGQVSKQNMTLHRWFANKACPGNYLVSKHPYIVSEVNKKLTSSSTTTTSSSSKTSYKAGIYKVVVSSLNIRKSASTTSAITGVIRDKGKYTITQIKTSGNYVWGKLKSGAGWICIKTSNSTYATFVK